GAANALGIAPLSGEEVAKPLPALRELAGRHIGRLPAIGLSGHHRQRTFTHSRDPHRRPRTLHRGRAPERAGQLAEPSATIDGAGLPERPYPHDGFLQPGHALRPRRIRNAVTLPELPGRVVFGADA